MLKLKQSLAAAAGAAALIALLALPAAAQEQKKSDKPPQDVSVVNSEAAPVPVRDVDNPARQPIQYRDDCGLDIGIGCFLNNYTVPAGKRLVIEYVSTTAVGFEAENLRTRITVSTVVGGQFVTYGFPASAPAINFGGRFLTTFSQQVRLYADPGTNVTAVCYRSAASLGSELGCGFSFSGYLVDVP